MFDQSFLKRYLFPQDVCVQLLIAHVHTLWHMSTPYSIDYSMLLHLTLLYYLQNGGFEYLKHESPEIFTLQEVKCSEDDLPLVSGQVYCHKFALRCKW